MILDTHRFVRSLHAPRFIAVVAIFAPGRLPQASCVIAASVQASNALPEGWELDVSS